MSAPGSRTTASGASATIGGRSSTSKTRSKDTSAVITSTCTFDSEVSGPYSRVSSDARATRVPTWIPPRMTITPPIPYTRAVARAATVVSAAKKMRLYIAEVMPMSRTRPALALNCEDSSCGRPKILTLGEIP